MQKEIDQVCAPDAAGNCTKADPSAPGGQQPGATPTYATLGEAMFNLGYYDELRRRRLRLRPVPHQGLELRRGRRGRRRGPGPEPHRRRRAAPVPRREAAQIQFVVRLPAGRQSPTGVRASRAAGWPSFGVNPNSIDPTTAFMAADQVMFTQKQIAAVVAYERSL